MVQKSGPRFIPVFERKAKAEEHLEALRAQGVTIQPERAAGPAMACTIWGQGWCRHMESLPRIGKYLPKGKIYARNGSIRHLEILPGQIKALVMGTQIYKVVILVLPVSGNLWQEVKDLCLGRIESEQDLYTGAIPEDIRARLFDPSRGIFPGPKDFSLHCECTEKAPFCKHAAAALYGAGSRLDQRPELLFKLRGVTVQNLVTSWTKKLKDRFEEKKHILDFEQAKDIFDLEWDEADLDMDDQNRSTDQNEK
jgi:uncharacterized Zn finger protein